MDDSLSSLNSAFNQAINARDDEMLGTILADFDKFCRTQVEAESDPEVKAALIQQLLNTQKDWQSKILQLKSKVRDNIADIKSNGKKINKYLTSF